MDLIHKFRLAAEATDIEMTGGMEVNKKYPIVLADKNFHPTFGPMVTLILSLVGTSVAVCPLPLAYSQSFSEQDISDINSKKESYRLIYKETRFAKIPF
jgi:hypothetical protein